MVVGHRRDQCIVSVDTIGQGDVGFGMLSASPPTSCLSTCVVRGDDGKDVVG